MKTRLTVLAVSLLVATGLVAGAQQPNNPPPPPGGGSNRPGLPAGHPSIGQRGDVMMENFFPPELVMQNQKAIGLTTEQQTALRAESQKMMAKFTDLGWQMNAATETLADLVKTERPDEKAVMAELDKMLGFENEVKRSQVGLMVKIKNILTPEQQAKLQEIKRRMRPQPRPGMGPMQGPGPQGGPGGGQGNQPQPEE